MNFKIFTIDPIKEGFILEGIEEYRKRLRRPASLEICTLSAKKPKTSSDEAEIRRAHTELLFSRVKDRDYLAVLDENGRSFNSRDFARSLKDAATAGHSDFIFAIGGAFGWDKTMLKQAKLVLSLSDFTMPYQLATLMLCEQIYRAYSINNNLPYHK